ncbi:MAG: hypothetical protein HY941_06460 [Gammaproteobacteria bacterium]|nr:hypothetical protein [Gammaproteobacteria bacterium]
MGNLTGSTVSAGKTPQGHLQPPSAWAAGLGARHGMDVWAADLVDQYRGLGLSLTEATRFFRVAYTALGAVLEGIDHHALAAAPIPEQVSILLPRFDIARLANMTGVDTAQAQSAVAMLVLEFVMHAHPPF